MFGSYHPHLSLQNVSIDPVLARQLPKGLAYYYLALPLGQDEDIISVVMAHPDDQTARAVLKSVLGAEIAALRGTPGEIREALDHLWAGQGESAQILYWNELAEPNETSLPIDLFAGILSAPVTTIDASQGSLDVALDAARKGNFSLTVIRTSEPRDLSHLIGESATSLLLVFDLQPPIRSILLVLRGHSPDNKVLDWVIPLAQAAQASVTLLAVEPPQSGRSSGKPRISRGFTTLLSPESTLSKHVADCACQLNNAGIKGFLKLRQGLPDSQIIKEIDEGDYDLIAVAAEAHGEFIQQTWGYVAGEKLNKRYPLLVVKPEIPLLPYRPALQTNR
jgi:nucleotide-binding universal stress UspA family protein